MGEAVQYISVRDAIEELQTATLHAQQNRPATVRLPPVWSKVHAREEARQARFGQSSTQLPSVKKPGVFPSHEASAVSYVSNTSSVPGGHESLSATHLGAALNSASTHHYGCSPLKPSMTENAYSDVGNYSMFGSQAHSARLSSASFGFGTTTRDQLQRVYLSPAHLKIQLCRQGAAPGTYEVQSSLGPQVLNFKTSYPAPSFSMEERFEADRRDAAVRITPGPGAYRT